MGKKKKSLPIVLLVGPGGLRSRGAVPSIGLAAGARIAQAPALPPAPAPGACRAALQNCAGHGARFFHAAAARARRFNRVRAHIPGTDHASPGGRPRAPHAAVPSAALHLPGHFANCQSPKISVLRSLLTVATPYQDPPLPNFLHGPTDARQKSGTHG